MGDMGWGRRSAADEMVMMLPVLRSFNGPKTNAYRALVDPHKWTCGFISRADVADFLVKRIADGRLLAQDAGAYELTRNVAVTAMAEFSYSLRRRS